MFGETVGLVTRARRAARGGGADRRRISLEPITSATAAWPVQPRIVVEPAEKQAAFRIARAALAKSGTVTLELALAGVPMVAAYKVPALEAVVGRRLVKRLPSVILANLVLGENVVPEFMQEDCTPRAGRGAAAAAR